MTVHYIYINGDLDEKLTAKDEFGLSEIYGNIIQSLYQTTKEVLRKSTKDKTVKCGG